MEPKNLPELNEPVHRVSVALIATRITGAGVEYLGMEDTRRTNFSVYVRRSDRTLDHVADFSGTDYDGALMEAAAVSMTHRIYIEQVK